MDSSWTSRHRSKFTTPCTRRSSAERTRRLAACCCMSAGRRPGGFQVIEVWESKEQQERYNTEVVEPAMAQLSSGQPPSAEPVREEFEPRGLIVRGAQDAV